MEAFLSSCLCKQILLRKAGDSQAVSALCLLTFGRNSVQALILALRCCGTHRAQVTCLALTCPLQPCSKGLTCWSQEFSRSRPLICSLLPLPEGLPGAAGRPSHLHRRQQRSSWQEGC